MKTIFWANHLALNYLESIKGNCKVVLLGLTLLLKSIYA